MKKTTFLFILGFLALSFNGFSQIKVNSTGKVGINNTSPSYQLDVNGTFRVNDGGSELTFQYGTLSPSYSSYSMLGDNGSMWEELYATQAYFNYNPVIMSDINAKTDIRDLPNIKSKLLLLHPVYYKLKPKLKGDEKADAKIAQKAATEQLGLIAQEVQKIIPEIVTEKEDGTLGIRYTEFIPVLIKAVQEQQAEIDDLRARIEKLEGSKK
ncbi:tail fiber domain-containing protein [Maribellus sp. CM-23]|uniref:tail fiber domain-containing protein n=1 Tax=Maribellus sp. CM-23 TaxID=2781026 RepID=UPI001F4198B1|nr:tail fiber domain-containing protein [Maribellus sp. CM-23]MCE4564665.1 tail fiber domain-containing protein [Maribellus sp. CM-23]